MTILCIVRCSILNLLREKMHGIKYFTYLASQAIPRVLCNPKVHCRIHKCPPTVLILSQIDPAHTLSSHFLKIHLNIILPSTHGSSKWFFSLSLRFPHQNLYTCLLFPLRAICPAHIIFLDFITPNNIV